MSLAGVVAVTMVGIAAVRGFVIPANADSPNPRIPFPKAVPIWLENNTKAAIQPRVRPVLIETMTD